MYRWLCLNIFILFSIVVFCMRFNLNGLFIILIKKALFLPSLEESMLLEDMPLVKKDVLHVNYVLLLVRLELLPLKVNLDLMDQGEQLDTI